MSFKTKGFLLPILAVVGIIFGVRTVLVGSTPPPIALPVSEPAKVPFDTFVAGAGIIEARTENIAIASPLSGVVQEIYVNVGDKVKVGDKLFSLDDRELRAQLKVKKAALSVALAQRADAQSQLHFMQSVADKRALSEENLSKRQYALQIADANVTQAQADVDYIETQISRLIIQAPVAGTVLQRKLRLGEFAAAQMLDTPLLLLGDTEKMHVRVDIDENDAWRVNPQGKALAFLRGNNKLSTELQFVRYEPYVIPKRSLTGGSTERVDTRVLQALYSFTPGAFPVFVGQQMDVFIEAKE